MRAIYQDSNQAHQRSRPTLISNRRTVLASCVSHYRATVSYTDNFYVSCFNTCLFPNHKLSKCACIQSI